MYNTFLDDKTIYLITFHLIILFILAIFSCYIYRNIFFYNNNKSKINGYYFVYLLYDYHLNQNKTSKILNIHFCYFLINYLKNIVFAIYRCANIKADSILKFYYKYLLAENIKDYLVELNEVNNNKNSAKSIKFSSVILYYLYQNLMRIKISDMAENQMNYYDYFKNFVVG